jgi:Uma2 family endonuclease
MMSVTFLEQLAAGEAPPLVEFTVDQYHQMIRQGLIPEGAPIELLDGVLVWKDRSTAGANPMTHDPRHASAVTRLQRLERRLDPARYYLRIQLPVTLTQSDEPEPDVAVVRGSVDAFDDHHPGPADLPALVEVSDSSLRFDRTTKQRKYALAGIGQYLIVNLPENQIEFYTAPLPAEGRYAQRTDYLPGQSVTLALDAGETIEFAVADVLPS